MTDEIVTVDRQDGNRPVTGRALKAAKTRQSLLDAATAVIQRDGASSLTLDKVANEASISKGGLLHHFASKEALIESLLNETLRVAGDELERRTIKYEGQAGGFASAYLEYVSGSYVEAETAASSILAAAALDGSMHTDARLQFQEWQERLLNDDGTTELTALLARIIGDGLWLIDLFELAPPTLEQRSLVVDFVQSRIESERQGIAEP